ncbi:unnamed protein product [Mytilus coruscus]|uniref:Uncharacterized protein n=1 Tax=Mytilus coruscus TaxID=42192 RepID=A0A6J8ETJ6_MYTCO|nr:unnamed protein product [Mytilus coruscus]
MLANMFLVSNIRSYKTSNLKCLLPVVQPFPGSNEQPAKGIVTIPSNNTGGINNTCNNLEQKPIEQVADVNSNESYTHLNDNDFVNVNNVILATGHLSLHKKKSPTTVRTTYGTDKKSNFVRHLTSSRHRHLETDAGLSTDGPIQKQILSSLMLEYTMMATNILRAQ